MSGSPSRHGLPAATMVDFDGGADSSSSSPPSVASANCLRSNSAEAQMGFVERSLSAGGAAVLSAILVNPLEVAKTRLQAQSAGVPYHHSVPQHLYRRHVASFCTDTMLSNLRCSPSCARAGILGSQLLCPPDCLEYKGTLDVFIKVVRQEGFGRLWRGTNAGLVLAVPSVGIYLPCYDVFRNYLEEFTVYNAPSLTPYVPLVAGSVARSLACISCSPLELAKTRMQAYKVVKTGAKPPGIGKTLVGVVSSLGGTSNHQNLQGYRLLWTGVGAQLARDVPFSAICWSTLEPIRRKLYSLLEGDNPANVFGANFAAGFIAGSLAAAATCPLDVAKTWRQIEKDPTRALSMTTRQTLVEIWRNGGIKGIFTGVGPRVARAGPSVGIVISFYEVVKYVLHQSHSN